MDAKYDCKYYESFRLAAHKQALQLLWWIIVITYHFYLLTKVTI